MGGGEKIDSAFSIACQFEKSRKWPVGGTHRYYHVNSWYVNEQPYKKSCDEDNQQYKTQARD